MHVMKREMDTMAQAHLKLAESLRKDLEVPMSEFIDYQYVLNIFFWTMYFH